MSLKQEIIPYVDGNSLIAPRLVAPGEMQASDNGPMFTSEFFIMLKRQGEMTVMDEVFYNMRIRNCMTFTPRGALLNRAPMDYSQDSIDDYLGVAAACMELGNVSIPWLFLKGLWEGRGWMNNNRPGVRTREAFLARFPQLIAALIAAAYPSKRLKDRAVRLLAFPLFLYAALGILIACRKVPKGEADPWRLTWLLITALSPVSAMTTFASGYWYKRLRRAFPEELPGTTMRSVAKLYYHDNHPFTRYWID